MPEYGLTPQGPNIKRLDVIVGEIHDELSKGWGVNTRQNPKSFLNVLITDFADKIAELWEFGQDIYHSMYPMSAEGISLDNAAQFGGTTRETARKSYYPIHCTGVDGTVLAAGTMISSDTNPATQLTITESKRITRESFNKARIKIASSGTSDVYAVAINGSVFSFTPVEETAISILNGLAEAIKTDEFTATVDEENELLVLEAKDLNVNSALVLSENLTTETVTSIITFGTVETGDILIPNGVITTIVKADAGLQEVANLCGYIAGNEEESDAQFRKSYADKIFNRSSMMLESIRSAILNDVQGVTSVAPYENDSNEVDEQGRPPHSIEIVVDGGDNTEIAKKILEKKAGGISTFGDVEVTLPGAYDEDIIVRFNRPTTVYVWYSLKITLSSTESLPANYVDVLREVVLQNTADLDAGKDVVPQKWASDLYRACPGISYIDILLHATTEPSESPPEEYEDRSVAITARQRAHTTESMIEVEIDG